MALSPIIIDGIWTELESRYPMFALNPVWDAVHPYFDGAFLEYGFSQLDLAEKWNWSATMLMLVLCAEGESIA